MAKAKRLFLSWAVIVLAAGLCGCGSRETVQASSSGLSEQGLARITALMQENVDNQRIGGAVAAVARGGEGAYLECVGKAETYELALQLVRPGGRVMAFGITEAGAVAGFEPFHIVMNELAMTGSVASEGNEVFDAIKIVQYNRVALEGLVSARLPLDSINEGFERFVNDKSILKMLIAMY